MEERGGWRVGTFHIHISYFPFLIYFILLIASFSIPPPSLSDPAGKKTKVTVYRCSLYSVSLIFFLFFFLVIVCHLSFVVCRLLPVVCRCLFILFFLSLTCTWKVWLGRLSWVGICNSEVLVGWSGLSFFVFRSLPLFLCLYMYYTYMYMHVWMYAFPFLFIHHAL